jgi:hypothetical protein
VTSRFATNDAAIVRGIGWFRREHEGRVEADERGLSFDGALVVAREALIDAFVVPDTTFPIVHLRRRGLRPAIQVRVRDIEGGRALLRALGLGGSQHALSYGLPGIAVSLRQARQRFTLVAILAGFSFFPVALAGVALDISQIVWAYLAIWLAAMVGLAAAALTPTKLVIGGDGLCFTWLGASRFIAYADILVVNGMFRFAEPCGVQITLVYPEIVHLHMTEGALIYERIAEAVDAWWRRDGALETALVQRGPRDARGWLRALQGIGAKATSDYRSTSMADELWRIVEDVAAPADARAGAAAALRGALGDEGRARLRRAADATAMPRLRIAIETAASDLDDEALTAALAELEAGAALAKTGRA